MPKLAIYIPKDEMREIERWRKQINFSQVFMSALRREIRELSRSPTAPASQLTRAAEYYRRSLQEDDETLLDLGYQRGAAGVLECRLKVPVIRQLLALRGAESLSAEALERVSAAMGGPKALEKIAQRQGIEHEVNPTWRECLCRGFVRGVTDAWEKVCEEIRESSE